MSSSRSSAASRISDDEINDLISKLRTLLPQLRSSQASMGLPESEILKEACAHVKKLQREMDDLSQRLFLLLDSLDINSVELQTFTSFFLQL